MIQKRSWLAIVTIWAAVFSGHPGSFKIEEFDRNGRLTWSGAFPKGICSVEGAAEPAGPWLPGQSFYTTNSFGLAQISPPLQNSFYRLVGVDISETPEGFSNLLSSYGLLQTVAGKGQYKTDGYNAWLASYEGGPAINANLSRPHSAISDAAGNIYIADEGSNSILKVTPDGNIHTVAGTHEYGDNGDGPAP